MSIEQQALNEINAVMRNHAQGNIPDYQAFAAVQHIVSKYEIKLWSHGNGEVTVQKSKG